MYSAFCRKLVIVLCLHEWKSSFVGGLPQHLTHLWNTLDWDSAEPPPDPGRAVVQRRVHIFSSPRLNEIISEYLFNNPRYQGGKRIADHVLPSGTIGVTPYLGAGPL